MNNLEFDAKKAIQGGVVGMRRAYNAASQTWKDDAYDTIERITFKLPEWNIDEVWKENPSLMDGITDLRSIGGVLAKAKKNGLIETIPGKFVRSTRVGSNAKIGPVWRSVHYKKPVPSLVKVR